MKMPRPDLDDVRDLLRMAWSARSEKRKKNYVRSLLAYIPALCDYIVQLEEESGTVQRAKRGQIGQ